ncbi:hypothetical protein Geob_2638 [Geotalea daltonii FRC-32]|uniref:Uncharacterized protein n=1 Tax=Geotalea daltonii (strain DSM 22248 / JCM 15807 / FRC-32) TaxID=316067 RepID=B9M0Y5_GEODF|nr:hypothetical protein Geob_2638 [Geotalea daltonii FRC-32]
MSSQQWAILTLLGFYGWISSTVAFILTSFPSNGGFLVKKGIRIGSCVVFFFVMWIIGMLNA